MGQRKRRIKETYIISKDNIRTSNICKNCPCRIYNSSGIIKYGKGNLYGENIIVLPPYNTNDLTTTPVEEELIIDILSKVPITLEECYLTRAIKCYSISKGINRNATYKCFIRLLQEVNFIKPKRIICFGNETLEYPNWLKENNYKGQIFWYPTFMIKFYDEDNYNKIIEYMKKDILLL